MAWGTMFMVEREISAYAYEYGLLQFSDRLSQFLMRRNE